MANEVIDVEFDFAENVGFKAFEGGNRCSLLPFDGAVLMETVDAVLKPARGDPKKVMVEITAKAVDEDCKDSFLVYRPHVKGQDGDGKPMSRQFAETLHAFGMPEEAIDSEGKKGKKLSGPQILDMCKFMAKRDEKGAIVKGPDDKAIKVPRRFYVGIGSEMYEGSRSTTVTGAMAADRFEKLKKNGQHRRPPVVKGGSAGASAGGGGGSQISMGGGTANGATPPPANVPADLDLPGV